VNEQVVPSVIRSNESVSLLVAEPLHGANSQLTLLACVYRGTQMSWPLLALSLHDCETQVTRPQSRILQESRDGVSKFHALCVEKHPGVSLQLRLRIDPIRSLRAPGRVPRSAGPRWLC
jgi:hypothetical protein